MRKVSSPTPPNATPPPRRPNLLVWLIAGCGVVITLFLLRPGARQTSSESPSVPQSPSAPTEAAGAIPESIRERNQASRLLHSRAGADSTQPPEVIVADKATAFARSRRALVEEMAQRFGVQVPPEVERFLGAAEAGDWDEIKRIFTTLSAEKEGGGGSRDLDVLWPAVREAYGVAAAVKSWPAQELLDYGRSILSVLPPGSVYIAGSEPARFIPTLLAETGGGERPVILPQNGIAEGNQLDYLSFLHADRLSTLSREDAQKAFESFAAEAQQNATANSANPSSASIPPAITGLNEKLLRLLMEKNPNASFALEQSTPMPGMYADALPSGPIFELRPGSGTDAATSARAGESINYWRETAQRLQNDSSIPVEAPSRTAYAQMATAQAQYFVERNLPTAAEQAFRIAHEIAPASVDALGQLTGFLARNGRPAEALQIVDDFARQFEEQQFAAEQLRKEINEPPNR
jgi:hypothetical protein